MLIIDDVGLKPIMPGQGEDFYDLGATPIFHATVESARQEVFAVGTARGTDFMLLVYRKH